MAVEDWLSALPSSPTREVGEECSGFIGVETVVEASSCSGAVDGEVVLLAVSEGENVVSVYDGKGASSSRDSNKESSGLMSLEFERNKGDGETTEGKGEAGAKISELTVVTSSLGASVTGEDGRCGTSAFAAIS